MLTADLALHYQRGGKIYPRYLDADNEDLLQTANDLILLVTQHENLERAALERALDEYIGAGTDYRILRGLVKLLMDRCEFQTSTVQIPAELRQALFFKAAQSHPLTAESRAQTIDTFAAEMNCSASEIMTGLYGDLNAKQRLVAFDALTAQELLDLYNLAQAQALFYQCTAMTLWLEPQAPAQIRSLFTALKHYGLIFTLQGNAAQGYEIQLSGPVSLFHRSQKYGIQMAVFLPALLLHSGWRLQAEITVKNNRMAIFELDAKQTKLRSHYLAADQPTHNPLREKLLDDWNDSEWDMQLTQEIIDLGATAFIPDAVFIHTSGKKIYLELFGYWTPRFLQDRLNELAQGDFQDFIIAVSEEMRCSREAPTKTPTNIVLYKSALKWRDFQRKLHDLAC